MITHVEIREEFTFAYRTRRDVAFRDLRGEAAWHDVADRVAGRCASFLATGNLDDEARELAALYKRIVRLTRDRYERRERRRAEAAA